MNAEQAKAWRHKNPEKYKAYQTAYRMRTYERHRQYNIERHKRTRGRKFGLKEGEYDAMLAKQNGVCAACHQPERFTKRTLAVDHDHVTGVVRGLLCQSCNLALGAVRDSPEVLRALAEYLVARKFMEVACGD